MTSDRFYLIKFTNILNHNMEMEYGLACNMKKPIGISDSTGLVVYDSFKAKSGFNYLTGFREIKDLLIMENIAEGVGCTYLCGIYIFHKETKHLLKEVFVEKNVRYSRAMTIEIVSKALLELLTDSLQREGLRMDYHQTKMFIDEALDTCYFETSRKCIIEWAKSVGIISI